MTITGSGPYFCDPEAAINIVSIGSVTGGIVVETDVAHGYSNGDFVGIYGTTDYNGGWIVSGVFGVFFEIIDQVKAESSNQDEPLAFTTSQTGTLRKGNKDPSGLIGLSGVSSFSRGDVTVIDIGNNYLQVNGPLLVNPEEYCIISGGASNHVFRLVGANAKGYLGRAYLLPDGHVRNTRGTALIAGDAPAWFRPGTNPGDYGAVTQKTGSTLVWRGATVVCPDSGYSVDDGNKTRIREGVCISGQGGAPTNRGVISSFHNSDCIVDGFRHVGGELIFGTDSDAATIIGLVREDSAFATFPNRITSITLSDLDVGGKGNVLDVPIQSEGVSQTTTTVLGSASGTDLIIVGAEDVSSDGRNQGTVYVSRSVRFTMEDLEGAPVDGAAFYRDRNNGRRKNLNGLDDTADKVYEFDAVSGVTNSEDVVKGIVNVNGSNPRGTSNTPPYDIDFRGDFQVMGQDQGRFTFRRYGYLPQDFPVNLRGIGVLDSKITFLDDAGVTLTEAAADAVTGVSLTDEGTSPVSWNGGLWSITVTGNLTTNPSLTAEQLRAYVWSQLCKNVSFGGRVSGLDWHNLIPVAGTVTARGRYERGLLDSAITDAVTTIPLQDASAFPAAGGAILVDQEEIHYTGKTGNNLTGCTRGANGTTAAAHTGTALNPLRVGIYMGVRVVDENGDPFPGITEMTDDQGVAYVPPQTVTLQVIAVDTSGSPIQGARVHLEAGPGGPETQGDVLLSGITDASGVVQDTGYSYAGDQTLQNSKIRKGTTSPLYQEGSIVGAITSAGFTATITLIEDE